MARVQSQGLYEPSALGYLIAESILPNDPDPSTYTWNVSKTVENAHPVSNEILATDHCVVWSRNGTTKKVFNLDIEGEPIVHSFATSFRATADVTDSRDRSFQNDRPSTEPALVVILRSQAHIFLLSGDTHVLPLMYDVDRAVPCAYGFVLQRRLESEHTPDRLTSHTTQKVRSGPSLLLPAAPSHIAASSRLVNIPRTFAYTELLSELGLVVSGSLRKSESIDQCQPLPNDEDIIYMSSHTELADLSEKEPPIFVAVTVSSSGSGLSIWRVTFQSGIAELVSRPKAKPQERPGYKRKSSNVYGRQNRAVTPMSRGPGTFRESFGAPPPSMIENIPFPPGREPPIVQKDDLAAQLGHEFEQVGVQTRSARRVSSMLARTDLGGANERSAFNDLGTGSISRKSLSRSMRRGESLGGFSDRQSFGTQRRSSFQANTSVISDGTSFFDLPASQLLDEAYHTVGATQHIHEQSTKEVDRRPRNMIFMRIKRLVYEVPPWSASERCPLEVMTMPAPDRAGTDNKRSRILSICIMNRVSKEMTVVNIAVRTPPTSYQSSGQTATHDLKALEVQRGQAIVDACRLEDGLAQRLLILTQTREGDSVLHLEAPWSASYRVTLPDHYKIFTTANANVMDTPSKRRNVGRHRTLPSADVKISELFSVESRDEVLAVDQANRSHRLRFRLMPSDPLVCKILQLSNLIFPPEQHDCLLVAWWEVKRWLEAQNQDSNLEWVSITVVLFLLAVPFISSSASRHITTQKKKKGGLLRSSNGGSVDLANWEHMLENQSNQPSQVWMDSAAWAWSTIDESAESDIMSPSKSSRKNLSDVGDDNKRDYFLQRCANLAREFLQSPAGESAIGPEGYLPTAVNKDRTIRSTALATVAVGLHLVREEQKLDVMTAVPTSESSNDLAAIISQLGTWLKWQDWGLGPDQYYGLEVSNYERWAIDHSFIDSLDVPSQPFSPPSVMQFVDICITSKEAAKFPSLLDLLPHSEEVTQAHPVWKEAARLTPRLFALKALLDKSSRSLSSSGILKNMIKCRIDEKLLVTIPDGIAAASLRAISDLRGRPSASLSLGMRKLLGREDLDTVYTQNDVSQLSTQTGHSHESIRDHHTVGAQAIDAESLSRWDASSELDRHAVTRLIFNEDRRFQEASKLVNQTRPPVVECNPEPEWTEADLLEAQKELAQYVTRRTLSVAAGRGMMHFNARMPLLTERVPVPAFSMQCVMKPHSNSDTSQPITFSADKNLFSEEKVCWAFFHNGVSAGLMISKDARWIDTSWILYNKSAELTNRHAGFLLSLGLNGHLKSLARWVAFKYLTPKHTMTAVGLLLGLSASYLGTMDTPVTRLLSVHVTRLLPLGAAEMNLSPLTQTTGIMGIGLLYYNSRHRRMSEIMLSEIENYELEEWSGDKPILRDEGYRLAAGFSLGLINLGCGQTLHSLHDMNVIERLLTIAIGTKNVNYVHVLDRATAGAVVAVMFIYMKTEDHAVAQKIDVPDTIHQFDYVRPDIFLLRTLAKHVIMWSHIMPTKDFIQDNLPLIYRARADLTTTKRLNSDDLPFLNILAGMCFAMSLRFAGSHRDDVRDLLVAYLDQFLRLIKLPALTYDSKVTLNGIRNCLDILALACSTVMSGSGDIIVLRRLRALHGRTDKDTPFGSHLAAHMALGALFLSGGTATFGTSNLAIASLVIAFYPLFPTDVLDNRSHLQALRHLWVLAVENRCLIARDVETGQVISDIAAQVRLLNKNIMTIKTPGLLPDFNQIRCIKFEHDSYWPVNIDFDSTANVSFNTVNARSKGKKSDPLETVRGKLQQSGKDITVSLLRRSAYEKSDSNTFMSELQALDQARGVASVDRNAAVNEKWRQTHSHQSANPFEWIFDLDAFRNLDFAERELVIPPTAGKGNDLKGTVVDTRLNFEHGTIGVDVDDDDNLGANGGEAQRARTGLQEERINRDKLWQLRLLLAWADRWEEQEQNETTGDIHEKEEYSTAWLKKEVVNRLRWRVWKMAGGAGE